MSQSRHRAHRPVQQGGQPPQVRATLKHDRRHHDGGVWRSGEVDMRRLAAGLWSGLWLLVMLAGLPWGLVVLFGWPVPDQPPDQPHLREWILATAVLTGWLVW